MKVYVTVQEVFAYYEPETMSPHYTKKIDKIFRSKQDAELRQIYLELKIESNQIEIEEYELE